VDLIAYVSRMPKPGETVHGNKYETGFGGKGANQCVAAAKLLPPNSCSMVGAVGNDSNGTGFLNELARLSIDISNVQVLDDFTTGVAPITVDETTGENLIVVIGGANNEFDLSPSSTEAIQKSQISVFQNEIKLETTKAALKIAYESGSMTMFNPSPIDNVDFDVLRAGVRCLVLNEHEIEHFNKFLKKDENLFSKIDSLELIICTHGSKGAEVKNWKGEAKMVDIERTVSQVVDTTGAGDCFLGAFSAAWIKHNNGGEASFEEICEFVRKANNVASMSVEKKGTQASYPEMDDF